MSVEKYQNHVSLKFLKYIVFACMLTAGFSAVSQTQFTKGNLKVVVKNVKNNKGQIGFFLFNSADGFPTRTENARLSGFAKIIGNTAEYSFTNVPAGTYAVYVFHDEDNNKKLNTNFIGMPKEGIGVSNNAKGNFGPPKYTDAKFDFNKPELTITISPVYL